MMCFYIKACLSVTFFRSRLFFFLFVWVPLSASLSPAEESLFFSYFLSENPLSLSFENPRHLFNKNSISFFTIYYLARNE